MKVTYEDLKAKNKTGRPKSKHARTERVISFISVFLAITTYILRMCFSNLSTVKTLMKYMDDYNTLDSSYDPEYPSIDDIMADMQNRLDRPFPTGIVVAMYETVLL